MFGNFIYISSKRYAFKSLFNDFYASQVMFALKILGNKQDAEDVVQDVFLSIWRSNCNFKNEISFKSYLYMSTKNRCIDFIRKRKVVNEEIKPDFVFKDESDFADQILKNEAYSLLHKAIEKLPSQTKNVILRSMSGMSVQEVADSLGVSVNTVKTLKQKAYRVLRELYGDVFIILIGLFHFYE